MKIKIILCCFSIYFWLHLLLASLDSYLVKNISFKNTNLIDIRNYFLKKINNTKIFSLDDETLLMEFDERVLDG